MQKKDMEKIYGMHYRELYLYAHSLCRNEEQAKDLTSETFYRAFVSFAMKEEKLKYWLFRVYIRMPAMNRFQTSVSLRIRVR